MPDEPWYKEGLNFSCTECGDCCSGEPGFVWVKKTEIEAIARQLGIEQTTFEKRCVRTVGNRRSLMERNNGDCVLLDGETRKCTVYEARPVQCRTWPFWQSNIRTPEAWEVTCRDCPGSGQGRLYRLAEIERQAKSS